MLREPLLDEISEMLRAQGSLGTFIKAWCAEEEGSLVHDAGPEQPGEAAPGAARAGR